MRLRADQLSKHLREKSLAPIYCLSGDEPLQMIEAADEIRRRARELGFEERVVLDVQRDFDWNQLRQAAANLSLFSNSRIIDLRLGEQLPGKDGGEALAKYAGQPPRDNLLLISAAKLEKKTQATRWYRALERVGVTMQIWPVDPPRLPGWIARRAKRLGKTIDAQAAELIAHRVEGNLLAARQELEKLALLIGGEAITVENVMQGVTDSARFEAFAMVEACYLGRHERAVRMLRGMRQEGIEVLGIFGAFMWELRRLCSIACAIAAGTSRDEVLNALKVWPQRRAAVHAVLDRFPPTRIIAFLRESADVDRAAKGMGFSDPWELLERLLLEIGGAGTAETAAKARGRT